MASRRHVHIRSRTAWDWSDENPPWAYTSEQDWLDNLPTAGVNVVPLSPTGADFYARVNNTCAAGPCVIQLEEAVYHLTAFTPVAGANDIMYAFGIYHVNLRGFIGRGPDKTIIQMDADSMTQAQLDQIQSSRYERGLPTSQVLQTGVMRIYGGANGAATPTIMAGLTVRAADQQDISTLDASYFSSSIEPVQVPQPAPHVGIVHSTGAHVYYSHVRLQAVGRLVNSAPSFECSNLTTNGGYAWIRNTESDGRLSADIDPAQPVRCQIYQSNDAFHDELIDCWLHDSNASRYAVNDAGNESRGGAYILRRTKIERITINKNIDPALNGGASLGGWTHASLMGFESTSADVTVEDCILCMDNPHLDRSQKPMHLQFTNFGAVAPAGTLTVTGTEFRSSGQPTLEGWMTMRLSMATNWYLAGTNNTLFVYHPDSGVRLSAHLYPSASAWPPDLPTLASQGVTSSTHYIAQTIN